MGVKGRKPNHAIDYVCSACGTAFVAHRISVNESPLCKSCVGAAAYARLRAANYHLKPEYIQKQRTRRLEATYGMTDADYDRLFDLQAGVCAICKKPETPLCVDHDHTTGKVRGLLCQKCNRAIGSLSDDISVLRSASTYLLRTDERRSWDDYFIEFARLAATRSKDPSSQVGAILVRDKVIISTGYNGFPRGANDNIAERYERPEKYKWMIHAEENSIYNAARVGSKVEGATLYVTPFHPCMTCAKSIILSGVNDVVVDQQVINPRYADEIEAATDLFQAAKVLVRRPE